MSKKQAEEFNFEQSIDSLEKIIGKMESGDLTLEQSLSAFEQGIALTRACQQALSTAELKVQSLVESNGELKGRPLDIEEE